MTHRFELFLFSADPWIVTTATAAGIDGIIVDWETKGKQERQKGFNTQINAHNFEDLKRVRALTKAKVLCRINAFGPDTAGEIELAIRYGADEILVPMVRTVEEVEAVLSLVGKRALVGAFIETNAATEIAVPLSSLPLSRLYVGLNDLAIENHDHNIFTPVVNGVLETIRNCITIPFGFGGLTLPHRGHPIPCRLLIAEMMRLQTHFSFLRRSFLADVQDKNFTYELQRLREALEQARLRTAEQIAADREELTHSILHFCGHALI
jgi:hypothetical protein